MTRDEANALDNAFAYLAVFADMHKKANGEIQDLWMFCLDTLVTKVQRIMQIKPNEMRHCIQSLNRNDTNLYLEKRLQKRLDIIGEDGYKWLKGNIDKFS